MKCPKCGFGGCKYVEQRKKECSRNRVESKLNVERTNFNAECKKCGFKGVV